MELKVHLKDSDQITETQLDLIYSLFEDCQYSKSEIVVYLMNRYHVPSMRDLSVQGGNELIKDLVTRKEYLRRKNG